MDTRQNILYVLGAGFSAPLGLPVMGDFIFKAKGIFAQGDCQHKYFSDVFQ